MKTILPAAIILALSGGLAAAEVVCNEEGDCWRTNERVEYSPELKLQVYEDDWTWDESDKNRYRWRDAGPGRGYWREGVWVEIK